MADITSANVVGYYGKDITKGKGKVSMFSLAFSDVSGDGFNFNTGLNVKNVKGTDDSNTSDHVLLWDPTKAGGAGGYLTLWYYDDGSEAGWCDPDGNYIDDPDWSIVKDGFAAGSAFWFEPVDDQEKEMTISGAVDGADYIEPPLAGGKQLSMFSNPFPVQIQLNDKNQLVCSGITGTDDSNTSDHLLLWDPTKAGGAGGYLTLWFYDDGAGDCGWCDPDGNYIDDPEWSMFPDGFAPGTAFWFEPVNANEKCFRFLNPIKK